MQSHQNGAHLILKIIRHCMILLTTPKDCSRSFQSSCSGLSFQALIHMRWIPPSAEMILWGNSPSLVKWVLNLTLHNVAAHPQHSPLPCLGASWWRRHGSQSRSFLGLYRTSTSLYNLQLYLQLETHHQITWCSSTTVLTSLQFSTVNMALSRIRLKETGAMAMPSSLCFCYHYDQSSTWTLFLL